MQCQAHHRLAGVDHQGTIQQSSALFLSLLGMVGQMLGHSASLRQSLPLHAELPAHCIQAWAGAGKEP